MPVAVTADGTLWSAGGEPVTEFHIVAGPNGRKATWIVPAGTPPGPAALLAVYENEKTFTALAVLVTVT